MPRTVTSGRACGTRSRESTRTRLDTLFCRLRREEDCAAREELIKRFMPLARKLARRYARSSEPYEDLIQVASLALVKAVDRFDPDRGTSFQAFAIPTILGDLRRYFRDCAWSVHVPRGAQERALAIDHASDRLTNLNGRPPTVQEIASFIEASPEEILDGLYASQAYDTLSLDAPRGTGEEDGDATLVDALGAEDERYELIEADLAVASALHAVPDREREILRLRFVEEMTQSEIAARMGISQMQISRLLRRSLTQLRGLADAPR
jgi:RNA polymerase sigma-B factor